MYNQELVTISREQLYERLWIEPVTKIAKEYGISDSAIGKICKKHKIPKPPLGYWAKIQHGQKIDRPDLPKLDEPYLQSVRFTKKIGVTATAVSEELELLANQEKEEINEIDLTPKNCTGKCVTFLGTEEREKICQEESTLSRKWL